MFDRHRQPWQCSIVTDCGGELPWFCQLAVPTVWWLLLGNADTKSKSSTFPWAEGGRGSGHKLLVHKGEINYAQESFVTTPQPGK